MSIKCKTNFFSFCIIVIFHLIFVYFLVFMKNLSVFRIEYRHSISFRVKIKLLLFEKMKSNFVLLPGKILRSDDGRSLILQWSRRWSYDSHGNPGSEMETRFFGFLTFQAQTNWRAKPSSNAKKNRIKIPLLH